MMSCDHHLRSRRCLAIIPQVVLFFLTSCLIICWTHPSILLLSVFLEIILMLLTCDPFSFPHLKRLAKWELVAFFLLGWFRKRVEVYPTRHLVISWTSVIISILFHPISPWNLGIRLSGADAHSHGVFSINLGCDWCSSLVETWKTWKLTLSNLR